MNRVLRYSIWVAAAAAGVMVNAFACTQRPTAQGRVSGGTPAPGQTIVFTGADCTHPFGDDPDIPDEWEWDFDYRGQFQPDVHVYGSAYTTWVYEEAGCYTVALKYYCDRIASWNIAKFQVSVVGLKRSYGVKDHLGSVRLTVDEAGRIVGYDDYDPWGMQLAGRSSNLGNANDRYKFTGKERDQETGYDYFGTKCPGVRMGRWLAIDTRMLIFSGWRSSLCPAGSVFHRRTYRGIERPLSPARNALSH